MQRLVHAASLASVACGLVGGAGCAGPAAIRASKQAVPVIVDRGLRAFEAAEGRERLARVLATPELRAAVRQAARDAAEGALAGAAGAEGRESLADLVDELTDVLARDVREEIVPSAFAAARQELSEPLTIDQRGALVRAVRQAVSEATRASMRAAAGELPTSLGPALTASLAAALQSPELDAATYKVVSDSTRHALVASADLLREMHEEGEGPSLIRRLTRYLTLILVFTFLMGAAALALALWTAQLARRTRRAEARAAGVRAPRRRAPFIAVTGARAAAPVRRRRRR
ncbi:MAG: hypothetical protein JOZ69_09905 [Myxococcales bacterium]|nr:hypothetical protein [Myxococcales bacterium]